MGLLLRVVRPRLPEPESELQRARAPARRGTVPGAEAGDQGDFMSSLCDIIIHDLLNVKCGNGISLTSLRRVSPGLLSEDVSSRGRGLGGLVPLVGLHTDLRLGQPAQGAQLLAPRRRARGPRVRGGQDPEQQVHAAAVPRHRAGQRQREHHGQCHRCGQIGGDTGANKDTVSATAGGSGFPDPCSTRPQQDRC